MSGGTVTLSSIGVLSLYLSQVASLIAIESWNLSFGLTCLGPSVAETYSLIAPVDALTLASRASRSAGDAVVVISWTLPSTSTTIEVGPVIRSEEHTSD